MNKTDWTNLVAVAVSLGTLGYGSLLLGTTSEFTVTELLKAVALAGGGFVFSVWNGFPYIKSGFALAKNWFTSKKSTVPSISNEVDVETNVKLETVVKTESQKTDEALEHLLGVLTDSPEAIEHLIKVGDILLRNKVKKITSAVTEEKVEVQKNVNKTII